MKAKYIIGGLIVLVFMIWGAVAFMKTTVQYVSLAEAKRSHQTVQAIGVIDFATVVHDAENSSFEFEIYDIDAADPTQAERMKITYYGVVPGNFDQATSVVVRGKAEGGAFVADQLLVKCPSKYLGEQNGTSSSIAPSRVDFILAGGS